MSETEITLTNFINLNETQKKMILKWRNHESVRVWMYNSEIITEKTHFEFIDGLSNNDKNIYFLVSSSGNDIGVIYFTNINKDKGEAYFGLYGNIDSKIRGLGRILEEVSIDYAFNNLQIKILKLEVFEENIKVINLHEKYGFEKWDKKMVNNKPVICMRLINENR